MTAQRLQQYVEEHRAQGGEAFRRRHDKPVLVREESPPDWDDDDRSYQTGFMARDELRRTTRQSLRAVLGDEDPEQEASSEQPAVNEVYVIAKREGAPFQDRIGIGRAPNTDVCIPLSRISKYHAFFTHDGEQHYITDAGSKNGTSIEGKAIPAKQATAVPDGARVHLGPYPFRFYTPDGFEQLIGSRAGGG